jgi:predicted Rossmann fold nucleotide-binding protein DprA/Smf involved in DNA uptake
VQPKPAPTIGGATEEEQKLLQHLLDGEKLVDDLIVLSGLETQKALALLTLLEIKGMIQTLPGRRVTLS